jgi:hypothetical protein
MSTLTYAGHDAVPAETAAAEPARKSLFTRLYDTIVMAQQERAGREIARYLGSR